MKTVKLFTALLMVVLCMGITSCSKDDDKEISLVGTWDLTKTILGSVSTTADRKTTYPDANNQFTITFNSDGSYSYTSTENGKTEPGSGKYTYDLAKKLLITTENGETEADTLTVKELTATSFVLTSSLIREDEYTELYYNKK